MKNTIELRVKALEVRMELLLKNFEKVVTILEAMNGRKKK